jgi:hypothetical protein
MRFLVPRNDKITENARRNSGIFFIFNFKLKYVNEIPQNYYSFFIIFL